MLPLLVLASLASADEGMWLPEQLPAMSEQLSEMGLELPAEQLADPQAQPLSAVVSLGFCSASFLSPDGLVATNHHCVESYLAYASDAEHNYAVDGFAAGSREGEVSAGPAARMYVVESIEDVTEVVNNKVRRWTKDQKRYELVERARKELVAECEQQENRNCKVAAFNGGQSYRLITRLEIKDLRLVYVPPESVGSYGGDIDNWMWPRHSGDFAMLRAYVAPDGSSAEYSADNVPYQAPTHLSIDPTGAQDGEFVMVAGYPGSTYRYRSARQMRFAQEHSYPMGIALAEDIMAILEAEIAADPEAAARLNSSVARVGNGLKYRQGNLDGFQGAGVMALKDAQWDQLVKWVDEDPLSKRIYGPALAEMDLLQAEIEAGYDAAVLLGYTRWMVDPLAVTHRAWRFAVEAEKPDLERERGYQERDRERALQRVQAMENTEWTPADKALLTTFLGRLQELPAEQRIASVDAWLQSQGGAEAAVEELFKAENLLDTAGRLALYEQDVDSLRASDNPWVQLAIAVEEYEANKRVRDEEIRGAMLRLQPLYLEALAQSRPGPDYPDANGTLRVTVGHVRGYSPRDAVNYAPLTTLSGMVAKAGPAPFDAPPRFLEAAAADPSASRWYDAELGDVPVNFTTTLDTTGGNSGSATINGRGELVGFIFDGNYEAMSADWLFDPQLTRSIHVDIRYVLWLLENDGQGWLLDELDLAGQE